MPYRKRSPFNIEPTPTSMYKDRGSSTMLCCEFREARGHYGSASASAQYGTEIRTIS